MTRGRTVQISGDKLSALFEESLLSQRAFGQKVGIKSTRLSLILRPGTHGILKDRFGDMARGLGLSEQELLQKVGAAPTSVSTAEAESHDADAIDALLTSDDRAIRCVEQLEPVRVAQLAQIVFWNLEKRVSAPTRRDMLKLTKLLARIEAEMEKSQAAARAKSADEERQKQAG